MKIPILHKRYFSLFILVVLRVALDGSQVDRGLSTDYRLDIGAYENKLTDATYSSILAMVEPGTGLPHDRFDASLFDIMPQFAVVRTIPERNIHESLGAKLKSQRSMAKKSRHGGDYGLKIKYETPSPDTNASYNVESTGFFDVSKAVYLQAWVRGEKGGEKFEFVLWGKEQKEFPGRPASAEISVGKKWELKRILLEDFKPYVKDLSSLRKLSIGFNDSMSPEGIIYLDEIEFMDEHGNRVHIPVDEETSVTNIGLYISSVLMAADMGLEKHTIAAKKMSTTLASIESLPKWHGFPQTHNQVVSLTPSTGDTCISTVDLGYLAAGLIMIRKRMPRLSSRATALLEAMEWDWLYDEEKGLFYGCRYPEKEEPSTWYYDWLCADSRLAYVIGIGAGKIPPESWNNLNRQRETPRCVKGWHFEPGWDGGGLFMAFLPAIFMNEKGSELDISARNFVKDQIRYYRKIKAPAWGFSATALPPYGEEYCGYGCLRDDILVPHACILAIETVSDGVWMRNLKAFEKLGTRQPVTDGNQIIDFGFRASVNWEDGEVCTVYLILDQAMSFLSLLNHKTNGIIRKYFYKDKIIQKAVALIPDYKQSLTR